MNKSELLDATLQNFAQADFSEYFKQYTQLSKKHFKLTDLDVSPLEFQLWKRKGLSPFPKKEAADDDKREWVRLDFTQYIWLRMVKTLRAFGYSFENIKNCKDYLFSQESLSIEKNISKDDAGIVDRLYDYIAKDSLPPAFKGIVNDVLKSEVFQKKIASLFTDKLPFLEILVFQAIMNKNTEIGVGFFENGVCKPFDWNMFLTFDGWHPRVSKADVINASIRTPHIYISITKYIIDFIIEDEKERGELSLVMLSENEQELLQQFRSNEFKNITINYDKGVDSKIIKTEKEKRVKESEIASYIKNIIFAPHCTTTYTKANNGDLIINSIKTKKLNK